MRRHPVLTSLLLLAVACGDSTPRAASSDSGADSVNGAAADSTGTSPPAGLLTDACVAGDPEQGTPWTLSAPAARSVTVESIAGLAPRDSARLAARVSRTVDVLPSDTTIADFRGLPVAVRAAWRIVPAPGDTVIFALVVRRMPMESAPLEEVFTVIAVPGERPGVRDPLVEAWVVRDVGSEETLTTRELLGAFATTDGLALVLMRDEESGRRAELLTRRDGRWGVTWSGVLPDCAP